MSQIDDRLTQQYWERAGENAASSSTMAHEQGLPPSCIAHRVRLERESLASIASRMSREHATVLDLGCGGGEWTAYFAGSAARVVGVERSSSMIAAARERTRQMANVELVQADVSTYLASERFELVFLGGLLMYLDHAAAVRVLENVAAALEPGGIVIARESTVPEGVLVRSDGYHVVYRSVAEYRRLFAEAGLAVVEATENVGYRHMEIASELVDLLRSVPGMSRVKVGAIGSLVWQALSRSGHAGMDLLPRLMGIMGRPFPRLSNHFFVLRPQTSASGL